MLSQLVFKTLLVLAFSGSMSKGYKHKDWKRLFHTPPSFGYSSLPRFAPYSRIPPLPLAFPMAPRPQWSSPRPQWWSLDSSEEEAAPRKQFKTTTLLGMAMHFIDCPNAIPNKYGCWCGLTIPFPAPHEPVDHIDGLCKVHDYCYADALKSGCTALDEYVLPYQWEVSNAGTIKCAKNQARCQRAICQCDKKVVEGLATYTKKNGCLINDPGCPMINV